MGKAENEASITGRVMRDMIAHFTNDNLIGRKIKSGEARKNMVEPPWKCPDIFNLTVRWKITKWNGWN